MKEKERRIKNENFIDSTSFVFAPFNNNISGNKNTGERNFEENSNGR